MRRLLSLLLLLPFTAWSATDATGRMDIVSAESVATRIDVSTDASQLVCSKCALVGIYFETALSAHVVALENADTTAIINLVASTAAGVNLEFPGVRFEASLYVDPNDSSTGTITLFWRPL